VTTGRGIPPTPPARKRGRAQPHQGQAAARPDRRRKRKTLTKAVLRRRIQTDIAGAVAGIRTANRIDIAPEKKAHLERAAARLEAALEERAGSHLLRQQLALCREALRDIEIGAPGARTLQVEILIEGW
jgi:hypothetical protein